jgi:hypothetical protein
MRRIASCVSLRRGQDEALGLRLPVVSGAAPVRKIIIAPRLISGVTPCHAWQTRYYKDPWLNECAKVSTQEYCLAVWNKLLSPPQGMTCKLGPEGNTIDCDQE